MMPGAKDHQLQQPRNKKISSADNLSQQVPTIVRETLRGQVAGLACELNVIMHMGLDEEDDCGSEDRRRFGDPHKLLRGRVGGTLVIPTVDSEVLYILDGSVDLCWKDERTPYTQYMHYHLLLASATGARFVLNGKKEMRPFLGGVFSWDESRTLMVKFQQIAPSHTAAAKLASAVTTSQDPCEDSGHQSSAYPILEGVLTVGLIELLKSTIALQGSDRFTFVKLLMESLVRTYILKNPLVASRSKQTAADSQKAVQVLVQREMYPGHVLHEIITDDGVKISAKQWLNPDTSEKPTSSNVVLLLNGHSTESFSLPTESKDLVRILFHSGYEPWLMNTRLFPLHIPEEQFSLDEPAKYDLPAVFKKIEEVRGNKLPIHVIGHCVGGLHIHMAILGGYVHRSRIASLLCTNSSMFFTVTKLAMTKLVPPLMPISIAILGKDTAFHTRPTSEGGPRHQLLRFIAQQIPRLEFCNDSACNTFSGVFGNSFWHANITQSVHANYVTPAIFPMCALPHIRKIILKGHLIDAAGGEIYMTHPERLQVPTTYINGGKEILVSQKTGKLAYEFMKSHHPQFVHSHQIVPDYGHADLLVGENSSKDVFPRIIDHLRRVREGKHFSEGILNANRQLQEWELEPSSSTSRDYYSFFGVIFIGILSFLLYRMILKEYPHYV